MREINEKVPIRGETIWITGASSGLGLALSELLAGAANHVIVSGRNSEALNALKQRHAHVDVLLFDITDTESLGHVRDKLATLAPHLNRVILNAGTCEYFDIETPDWSMAQRVMAINYQGMVNCVEIAMPLLQANGNGHFIGIGSQAVLAPFPKAEAYGASKAAIHYYLEALRIDVKRFNIDVSVILPGFIDTPLTRKNTFDMPFIMSSHKAALRIVNAVSKRKLRYTFPKRLSVVLAAIRLFPRWWVRKQSQQQMAQFAQAGKSAQSLHRES